MQARRISPEKMLSLLRAGEQTLEAQNAKAAEMIFGRLRQVFSLSTITDEEAYLLKNLSLIPLNGIQVETFYDWCGLEDFDLIDGLIRRSWVLHDPVTDSVHLHPLVAELMAEELARDPDCCSQLIDHLLEIDLYSVLLGGHIDVSLLIDTEIVDAPPTDVVELLGIFNAPLLHA